jgi:iron complex outermembrane receptor protein
VRILKNMKLMSAFSRVTRLSAALVLLVGGSSLTAYAQQTEEKKQTNKRVIEEVIVSATKREQVSQDVPISMSVMSDIFLKEQGITDIGEALLFTPNFSITETNNSVTPQCRGFVVETINPGFEPPCGLAVDGVAYTRPFYFATALFDIKRLEVLRGPQGTTFGKNTTAGVVSIITKAPTDEFTADVDLKYGNDRKRVELGLGGPIVEDIVNFRLAGVKEKRDGYVENTTAAVDSRAPESGGGRDREALRARLHFLDVFGSEIKLAYERAELSYVGTTTELILDEEDNASLIAYFRQYDPNADFERGNYRNSVSGKNTGTTEVDRVQLDWLFAIGEWDYTAVAAAGELGKHVFAKAANTPVDWVDAELGEKSPFQSIELRVLSPDFDGFFGLESLLGRNLGISNMIAGVYYQEERLDDADLYLGLDRTQTAGIVAAQNADNGGANFPIFPVPLAQDSGDDEAFNNFDQQSKIAAIFGSFTWNLTEEWMLEMGARYSEQTKAAQWELSFSDPSPVFDPNRDRGFVAERKRTDYNVQPKISIGFAPTDDLNFFAHWTQGFKSGGFNQYTISGNPEEDGRGRLDFEPEVATEWGLDAKMKLLEGAMSLNVSLFRLDVTDFQVLTEVFGDQPAYPASTFRLLNGYTEVVNADKARAQGVEVDLTWLANDWLTIIGAVGYNDTEYLSYTQGTCTPAKENEDPETGKCDFTGKAFPYTAKMNNTLTLQTRYPLGEIWNGFEGLDFTAGATVEYKGSYNKSLNLDPTTVQESFYRLRANLGLSNMAQGWKLTVIGQNLTDEIVYVKETYNGTFRIATPDEPRAVFVQLNWSF